MEHGYALFNRLAPYIVALPPHAELHRADLLSPRFLLQRDGRLSVYYIPFEYVNTQAKVVLVGITPGWTQMQVAYQVARDTLQDGVGAEEVCDAVDRAASFAGSMRANLITMLDALDLPRLLGVESSTELFADRRDLLHTTSAVRYPVFIGEENYTGHTPPILQVPLLRSYISEVLASELAQVQRAVIVPLGKAVSEACLWLVEQDLLDERRCLIGFPHPSGANGHRQHQFQQQQRQLQQKLTEWFS